jgi:hypothetical protein
MQIAIKLESISNLITSPSNYQCRKTTVNMKVSDTVNMKVDFVITCISIITDFHSKYKLDISY